MSSSESPRAEHLSNFPCVRVRLKVQLSSAPIGYVRVELGRREVCVPEHLLHRAQVGAALEEMGGERVPQEVRMDTTRLEARGRGEAAQDQEGAGPGERAALGIQEELGAVALVEVGAPARVVSAQGVDSL